MYKLLNTELEYITNVLFNPCGLKLTGVEIDAEAKEYAGHNIQVDALELKFRVGKITPTKTGQFVTLWKRNAFGITEPYSFLDKIDACIILTRKVNRVGFFIFSKRVMLEQGILSSGTNVGKRGFRVYPSWDVTSNKQAQKTQTWQSQYFIELSDSKAVDMDKVMALLKSNAGL